MRKRIALFNDFVSYGKSSITTQIPIISAFGDIPYAMMSSYLSNSAMYEIKNKIDLCENFKNNIDCWRKNNFKFDAVITGYLNNSKTILDVKDYLSDLKLDNENMLIIVDPSFADNGEKYCNINDEYVSNIKKLSEIANVFTPNLTEACIITNENYDNLLLNFSLMKYEGNEKEKLEVLSNNIISNLKNVLNKLIYKNKQVTIITGINLYNAVVTVLDCYDGDIKKRRTTCNFAMKLEDRMGTGDMFNAVFLETSFMGYDMVDSLTISTSFVTNALRFTIDNKYPKEEGLIYEPILTNNVVVIREKIKKIINEKNGGK